MKGRSKIEATPTPFRAGVLWFATLISSLRLDRLLATSSCSSSEDVVLAFLRPGPDEEMVGDERFGVLLV